MSKMAKAVQQSKPPVKQEVKPAPPAVIDTPVPTFLQTRMEHNEGRGVSSARADNIIPLIYVLQKASPCTDERSDAYVDGAKAGEFWVRGTEAIFSGLKGIKVQPCAFLKCWIEWGPKRGDGFKGRHAEKPDDAEEKEIRGDDGRLKMVWARPNGNIVVETREEYVLMNGEPYVIPFTSTGHSVHRKWMTLMNQFRDKHGRPLDSWYRFYTLTTVRVEKDGNAWYVIKAVDADWIETDEQFVRGLRLHQAVMSGEKVAEAPLEEEDEEPIPLRDHEEANKQAEEAGI